MSSNETKTEVVVNVGRCGREHGCNIALHGIIRIRDTTTSKKNPSSIGAEALIMPSS